MRRPRLPALALLALALALPSGAHASTSFGLRLFGGYDRFGMGDWNDIVGAARMTRYPIGPTRAGHSLGAAGEWIVGRTWCVVGGYERMIPARREDAIGRELKPRANAILLGLEARRRAGPRLRLGAGGGAGFYLQGDEVDAPGTGVNFTGDGWGPHATGLAEWTVRPTFSVMLEGGYRWAKVEAYRVNQRRVPPPTRIEFDYSGLVTRLAIRLHPVAR